MSKILSFPQPKTDPLAAYSVEQVALAAVEIISERVERGTWHYWHCSDKRLLTNLYDVLDALENGELMQPGLREAA